MWCPFCKERTKNEAIGNFVANQVDRVGVGMSRTEKHDPLGFRRRRKCHKCSKEWTSVELPEKFVEYLLDIRHRAKRVIEAGLREKALTALAAAQDTAR